jgi:hypothetical protein
LHLRSIFFFPLVLAQFFIMEEVSGLSDPLTPLPGGSSTTTARQGIAREDTQPSGASLDALFSTQDALPLGFKLPVRSNSTSATEALDTGANTDMSAAGTSALEQKDVGAAGTGANMGAPEQKDMGAAGTRAPEQKDMGAPGTGANMGAPEQKDMGAAGTHAPEQKDMGAPGTGANMGAPEQKDMGAAGTHAPEQKDMGAPGTHAPEQKDVGAAGTGTNTGLHTGGIGMRSNSAGTAKTLYARLSPTKHKFLDQDVPATKDPWLVYNFVALDVGADLGLSYYTNELLGAGQATFALSLRLERTADSFHGVDINLMLPSCLSEWDRLRLNLEKADSTLLATAVSSRGVAVLVGGRKKLTILDACMLHMTTEQLFVAPNNYDLVEQARQLGLELNMRVADKILIKKEPKSPPLSGSKKRRNRSGVGDKKVEEIPEGSHLGDPVTVRAERAALKRIVAGQTAAAPVPRPKSNKPKQSDELGQSEAEDVETPLRKRGGKGQQVKKKPKSVRALPRPPSKCPASDEGVIDADDDEGERPKKVLLQKMPAKKALATVRAPPPPPQSKRPALVDEEMFDDIEAERPKKVAPRKVLAKKTQASVRAPPPPPPPPSKLSDNDDDVNNMDGSDSGGDGSLDKDNAWHEMRQKVLDGYTPKERKAQAGEGTPQQIASRESRREEELLREANATRMHRKKLERYQRSAEAQLPPSSVLGRTEAEKDFILRHLKRLERKEQQDNAARLNALEDIYLGRSRDRRGRSPSPRRSRSRSRSRGRRSRSRSRRGRHSRSRSRSQDSSRGRRREHSRSPKRGRY